MNPPCSSAIRWAIGRPSPWQPAPENETHDPTPPRDSPSGKAVTPLDTRSSGSRRAQTHPLAFHSCGRLTHRLHRTDGANDGASVTTQSKNVFPPAFSLGSGQAEADPLLHAGFFESAHYRAAESREDPRSFIIARTGAGKTALLERLERVHQGHVIRISPDDLSLPYITERDVFRVLQELGVNLDNLFVALWKHVLIVEIIRHRYSVDSEAAKRNFLSTLRETLRRDPGKKAALEYLDDFEGKFWCDADERVRQITDRIEEQLNAAGKASGDLASVLSIGFEAGGKSEHFKQVRREYASKFQRIVNETQLARLNRMMGVLDEDVLDSENHFTYVVIDDLDRNWVDERLTNDLVACLFSSVLDLQRVRNLKILVALRVNLFEQLRYSRSTIGQKEKLRAQMLQMTWTHADLNQLLDARVRAATAHAGMAPASSVKSILPKANKKRGSALDYILDKTLMRPRDALLYLNEALALSPGKQRIAWTEIQQAEGAYSRERLLALRDEWEPNYPGIDRCLEVFRGASGIICQDEMSRLLDEVTLVQAEPDFPGILWLTDIAQPVYAAGGGEWSDVYGQLVSLFFRLGFIGIESANNGKSVYHHDNPNLLATGALTSSTRYFIHPAFHSALEIRSTGTADKPSH